MHSSQPHLSTLKSSQMKPTLPVLLLLLCHHVATAQKDPGNIKGGTVDIIYDMQAHKFSPGIPRLIKEGSSITLSYGNVNPFAFKSTAVFANINNSYEDGLSVVQSGLNGLSGAEERTEETLKAVKSKNMANFKSLFPNMLPETVESDLEKKKKLLGNIRQDFAAIEKSIQAINAIMSLDTLIKIAKNDPGNYSATTMEKAVTSPAAAYGITAGSDISAIFKSSQETIYSRLDGISGNITALKELINKTSKEEITRITDSLEKKVSALRSVYTGNNLAVLQKNTGIIHYNLNTLRNADYNLPPKIIGTATGDFVDISSELKDNNNNTVFSISPHRVRTYGGARVDFSIGLAANIGGNGAAYSLRRNPTNAETGPDTAKVTLYENNRNKLLQFNPAVFIHWYKTTTKDIQWMLTTGLAPDFSTLANSRLFVGTSLGFPASNDLTKRLVLSFGVSVGYADVLKNKYRDWNNYQRFNNIDDADLTEKALRAGGFFSVSYNLGGSGHKSTEEGKK